MVAAGRVTAEVRPGTLPTASTGDRSAPSRFRGPGGYPVPK